MTSQMVISSYENYVELVNNLSPILIIHIETLYFRPKIRFTQQLNLCDSCPTIFVGNRLKFMLQIVYRATKQPASRKYISPCPKHSILMSNQSSGKTFEFTFYCIHITTLSKL
jgi:hypothetical protein